jgi:hypothetical protein
MFSTICYVVLAAVLGFVFRFFLLESYGPPLAVALLNGTVPLVRRFETSVLYTRGNGPGGKGINMEADGVSMETNGVSMENNGISMEADGINVKIASGVTAGITGGTDE